MLALSVGLTLDVDRYVTSLVVGPIIADRLATRAKGGDRYLGSQNEIVSLAVSLPEKSAVVIHEGSRSRYRRFTLEKVWECDLNSRALGLEPLLHGLENRRQRVHRHFASMLVENFEESAHVCALELMRKIHGHRYLSNSMLPAAGTVENHNWIP